MNVSMIRGHLLLKAFADIIELVKNLVGFFAYPGPRLSLDYIPNAHMWASALATAGQILSLAMHSVTHEVAVRGCS